MPKSAAQAAAGQVDEPLAHAWNAELPPDAGISTDRAEALTAEIRTGREAR